MDRILVLDSDIFVARPWSGSCLFSRLGDLPRDVLAEVPRFREVLAIHHISFRLIVAIIFPGIGFCGVCDGLHPLLVTQKASWKHDLLFEPLVLPFLRHCVWLGFAIEIVLGFAIGIVRGPSVQQVRFRCLPRARCKLVSGVQLQHP